MFLHNFLQANKKAIITACLLIGLTVGSVALGSIYIYGGNNVINGDSADESGGLGSVTAVTGVCSGNEPATQLCNTNIYELEVGTDITVDDDLFVTDNVIVDDAGSIGIGTNSSGALVNGYSMGMVFVDLATSSAGVVNPESETIYVYDASYRIQTATTSAYRVVMGTSTSAVIAKDGSCLATACDNNADDRHAAILDTGASGIEPNEAANTTLFKMDYQGVDTRDGSGIRYVVPVANGAYLTCFASTSAAANGIAFDGAGQCQFKYYIIED